MRHWLAALLLWPAVAFGQASFIQIGDPQFGITCDTYSNGGASEFYAALGGKQCLQKQLEQAYDLLNFAEAKGVDFVIFMGDHNQPGGSSNQDAGSDTRLKLGELITDFAGAGFDIKYTIGNHDYESACQYLQIFMLDNGGSGSTVRNDAWETWSINNVYFVKFPTPFFSQGTPNPSCAGFDTNQCIDISGTPGAACAGTSTTDTKMIGTPACGANEICNDIGAYETASWTAISAHIAAWAAAGQNARLFTFSHWPPWWKHDMTVPAEESMFNVTHKQNIEAAVAAGVTTLARPFTMLYGHWHENTVLGTPITGYWQNTNPALASGITSTNGVYYVAFTSSGFARGKVLATGDENDRVSGSLWEIDANGDHQMTRILATGQRGGLR